MTEIGGTIPSVNQKKILGKNGYLYRNKYIMGRIVKLTESDLTRLVKKIIKEDEDSHTDKLLDVSGKITDLLGGMDIIDEDELYDMSFEDLVDEVRKLNKKKFFRKSMAGIRRIHELEKLADELESLLNEE
jgi:hypothetical protein